MTRFEAQRYISVPQVSHREKDDTYPAIAMVSDKVRVINCKDDLQWIVQRRMGDEWRGLSFCRTRATLIRDTRRRLNADIPAEALAILQALPEMHP